jgi:hypothetical protein
LALISADGEHRFYAEIEPLPADPTQFVREVVYPLLDRGPAAISAIEITSRLRQFLISIDDPLVVFDHENDGVLLGKALAGFPVDNNFGPPPAVTLVLVTFGDVMINIERYFVERLEVAARRHHAAVDADALRWAFTQALGG